MTIVISMVTIAVLTAADQIIKIFVENNLKPIGSSSFIDGFVDWHYVRNTGAAFGSFGDRTLLLSIFTGIALAIGIYLIISKRIKSKFCLTCAVMIIAGGLGNLIDRIFRGFVIDYIEVQFMNFAIFNFADILVTVGAMLLIVYLIIDMFKGKDKKPAGDKLD